MSAKGFGKFWRAFNRTATVWAHSTQLLLLLPVLALRRAYRKTVLPFWRRLKPGVLAVGRVIARIAAPPQSPDTSQSAAAAPPLPILRADQFQPGRTALPPPLFFFAEEAALASFVSRPQPERAAPPADPSSWPLRMMRRLRRASRRKRHIAQESQSRAIERPEKPVQSTPLVTPSRRIQPF
ncbi:MAG: hypothetical protein IPK79_03535 [Vampirovibrionales bacterium]|nr:hypothetical protein [Vampirovibrionales bacterium]